MGSRPVFGKVEDASGAPEFLIDWGSGRQSTVDDTNTLLDEITTAGASTLALIGKRVRVSGQNAALDVIVIHAYSRATVDMVLGQTQSGAWRELPAADVTVIP
jgi:hypothetical protein